MPTPACFQHCACSIWKKLPSGEAVIAVTLALMANLVFKIGLVLSIGGGRWPATPYPA
jgi:hypothetical protein